MNFVEEYYNEYNEEIVRLLEEHEAFIDDKVIEVSLLDSKNVRNLKEGDLFNRFKNCELKTYYILNKTINKLQLLEVKKI